MREFMDHVHGAFYEATGWSRDNSYAALNATSDALLNFPTPRGLRLTLSSLASPNFATSYQLGSVGVVDGSISYLFSSVPLRVLLTPQSERVALPELLRSYRPLTPLNNSRRTTTTKNTAKTTKTATKNLGPTVRSISQASLLYGRLYLPRSQLEALVARRLSERLQVQISAVSGQYLRSGGTVLGLAQYDAGRYAVEGLASSDGGLLGLRGVYNFGGDAEERGSLSTGDSSGTTGTTATTTPTATATTGEKERIYGRFSTGAEIYYGTLNKSGGISLATRFATLPQHRGTPLSATLTLNPVMGSVGASYAVVAGRHCTLATRLEFNVFSYESAWAVGMELWRKSLTRPTVPAPKTTETTPLTAVPASVAMGKQRSFQAKMEWRLDEPMTGTKQGQRQEGGKSAMEKKVATRQQPGWKPVADDGELRVNRRGGGKGGGKEEKEEDYAGVLKARLDQNLRIGLLWEGRVKSLLFSLGSGIDLRHMDKPFRTLGLEIQFSS